MHYELKKLSNNLNTLFVHNPGSTSATVQIWFRAGSALEVDSNEGIAHFLEHMFFKGTENRPGAKIAYEVESFGGEINAFTSFDYTCYYINAPTTEIKNTINILLDMVSQPLFKTDDLLPERDVVFEEFRRSIDSPSQFGFQRLQKNFFTGSYAHPILGREDTIKNFSREQLIEFRKNFYNLNNALLVVAGNISDEKEFTAEIVKYQLPKGESSHFPPFKLNAKPQIDIHHKDVRMATLTLCFEAIAFLDDKAAAEDLAINCFGYGETSRLYQKLVIEETLANNSSASTMFMNHGGAHFIRVTCPTENLEKILKKLEIELKLLLKNGVLPKELQRIKNQYVSSKTYEKETIESFAFSLGHGYAQTGDINSDHEFINRIKKTKIEDVNLAIGEIFAKPMHLGLQVPKSADIAKCKKMLEKFQAAFKPSTKKLNVKTKVSTSKDLVSKFDDQAKVINIKPGIKLLYRQNTMTPTFILHAYIKGGMTEESSKNNGIHHLLATTLGKGYQGVSYEKLKEYLEDKSSSLNGFGGKNAYGLLMHGLSDNFSELAKHFSGCLICPTIAPKFVKHEQSIAVRALDNQKEDPVKQCFQEVHRMIFDKHPYALNPIGEAAVLKKLKSPDIKKLHFKNLKQKEILFTYCGDKDLNEVCDALKSLFDKLQARKITKPKIKKYKAQPRLDCFIEFDREQTQIFIFIPAGGMNSKDNLYLKMLNTHLAGQSSELFVEVRDRQGLCYTAQPVHFTALEGGYFGVYMASGHDKTKAAKAAIMDIINRISKEGLPREDFDRIKRMMKGQNLINVQTNEDYASIYAVAVLQGQGIDYWHEKNREIEALKYEEFQLNIKKLLTQKWRTVVVGRK